MLSGVLFKKPIGVILALILIWSLIDNRSMEWKLGDRNPITLQTRRGGSKSRRTGKKHFYLLRTPYIKLCTYSAHTTVWRRTECSATKCNCICLWEIGHTVQRAVAKMWVWDTYHLPYGVWKENRKRKFLFVCSGDWLIHVIHVTKVFFFFFFHRGFQKKSPLRLVGSGK